MLIIKTLGLGCIVFIALYWDLKSSKIPNKLILSGMIIGVALNLTEGLFVSERAATALIPDDPTGVLSSLSGITLNARVILTPILTSLLISILIPFLSLIALYALKMLGAGDIKLFMSMGAIVGPWPIAEIMAYSFLAGGALSLFAALLNKQAGVCAKRFLAYVKACFLQQKFLPYERDIVFSRFTRVVSTGGMIKFSIAIAAGTFLYAIRKTLWFFFSGL
ncbi:MAG: A24 family peptidase [Oscillospiraceae bacterium]|nr:A24 family peptidase [Oscillospiraceae bacterium]